MILHKMNPELEYLVYPENLEKLNTINIPENRNEYSLLSNKTIMSNMANGKIIIEPFI